MRLADFRKRETRTQQVNPVVACNALYKTADNFNCYLTPAQAIALSRNLLLKAQLILDESLEGAAVQMWNQGRANEKLYCGLIEARIGGRKKPRTEAFTLSNLPKPPGK